MSGPNLQRVSPVSQSLDVDTEKSDTVDLVNGPVRGIHCNADGTVAGILVDETAVRTYQIKVGMYYPYAFKRITLATTSAGLIGLI